MAETPEHDHLLTPGEVAEMFRVDPRTVTKWAKQGKIPFIWTPGGTRRYSEVVVRDLLGLQTSQS
ncbi:BldC family transcriptional regulator [Actinomadura terrae]|uniref:BldC family transcriptional regulator n=1 Tax=Actinomadura terrae TaxID=604353 RepID=UPI001FA8046B|nr:BldC family transcriptional regulator [Actinomadura terrae]